VIAIIRHFSEQAITYLAASAGAGVALSGAAVAGARRHDEYRCR
jgi:hypothetical protein